MQETLKPARFAKTFDVGAYQLLVYIDVTDDESDNESDNEDYVAVHQMTDVGGALLDIVMRGPEAAMSKVFQEYQQQNAENFFTIPMVARCLDLAQPEVQS